MSFYIGSTIFNTKSTTEDEIKQDLFNAVQALPAAEQIPEKIEKNQEELDPKSVYGVLEEGYIVVVSDQTDSIKMAGTDRLYTCIGISIYDDQTHKVIVAHLDIYANVNSLDKILNEFHFESETEQKLEVRFWGGVPKAEKLDNTVSKIDTQQPNSRHEGEESEELAKKIYYHLYDRTKESKSLHINIISSNTFLKLIPYKKRRKLKNKNTEVSFVINPKNGKIQVFKNEDQDGLEYLPYTSILNCGLCSGEYKNGNINLFLHNKWAEATRDLSQTFHAEDIVKRYDGSNPNWNIHYANDREIWSTISIRNILMDQFNLIANDNHQTEKAAQLLDRNLYKWLDKLKDKKYKHPVTQYLLEYKKFEIDRKTICKTKINDVMLYKLFNFLCITLLKLDYYSDEQAKNVRNYTMLIRKSRVDIDIFSVAKALKQTKGQRVLENEYLDYLNKKIINGLLYRLINAVSGEDCSLIVTHWRNEKIKNLVKELIEKIIDHIQNTYNRELTVKDENKLKNFFVNEIQKYSTKFDLIDLDYLGYSGYIHPLVTNFARVLRDKCATKNCYCVFFGKSFSSVLDDNSLNELNGIFHNWVNDYVLHKEDAVIDFEILEGSQIIEPVFQIEDEMGITEDENNTHDENDFHEISLQ